MQEQLWFQISKATELTPNDRQALIDLCTAAYEETFDHLFDSLPDSTHIIARLDNEIVSHAAWVTRWLQPEGLPELRTAYIEAVATLPRYQGLALAARSCATLCRLSTITNLLRCLRLILLSTRG